MHTSDLTMKVGIKFRLAALGLGLALMGALIIVVTLSSQRQAADLRVRLNQVDSESFGIAAHFKDSLRDVNDRLRNYRTTRDPAAWEDFLKASHDLDVWIDAQAPRLRTQQERNALQQIDAAYDDYLRVAHNLHTNILMSAADEPPRTPTPGLLEASRRLADLGQAMAQAHYGSRNEVLAHANRTLTQLRLSVLWLVALLFLCGAALAVGVYRHMIAPLQVKLVESQALVERHEKLASLGMLAAGVAHEIRNPLTAIKAAVFLQQRSFQPGTREYADAELVEREILRLERIVNNFLRFARPAEPELATIPAEQPLDEVQGLLESQLARADIQLLRETSTPMSIRVDRAQIQQVLINLVQNAADSIGRGGRIALRARHDRKHLSDGEVNVAILEVTDSGKGIPPEVEKRLFDPFFTTKENGTGLGLSIAAQIVERHGGALQYQTQVNRGTTFGIVLPEATA